MDEEDNSKYWGAVYRVLDDRRRNQETQEEHKKRKIVDDRDSCDPRVGTNMIRLKETTHLNQTGALLSGRWKLIEHIQKGVRTEDRTERLMLKIPPALPLAFKDLILFFILIRRPVHARTESLSSIRRNLYDNCVQLLSREQSNSFRWYIQIATKPMRALDHSARKCC